jgi:hypothetical protein
VAGGEDVATQELTTGGSLESNEEPTGRMEIEHPERQRPEPAGLGDGDKAGQMNGLVINSGANANEFPSMPNMNTGFNNGMDYNQMMQFMSGNMGSPMGAFNPMMGKLDSCVPT